MGIDSDTAHFEFLLFETKSWRLMMITSVELIEVTNDPIGVLIINEHEALELCYFSRKSGPSPERGALLIIRSDCTSADNTAALCYSVTIRDENDENHK